MTASLWEDANLLTALFPSALALYLIVTACLQVIGREASGLPAEDRSRTVTVLVPAHNEERTLGRCLESLLASTHPHLRIVVVSDGSRDDTVAIARRHAARGVEVVELAGNGGKSAALAEGLARTRSELVLVIDADTQLAPGAISRLASAFADERVAAATANIRVGAERGLLARLQAVEYTSIVGLLKRSNAFWGGLFTVSGAAACYRVSTLRAVGGFASPSVTEDIELSWRLQRAGWRLRYVPQALASIEVPQRWRDLWRQRVRWSRGLVEVLRQHGAPGVRLALTIFTIECVLSIAWAIMLAVTLFLHVAAGLSGGSAALPHAGAWHGIALTLFLCQTLTASIFDAHYVRLQWRSLLLAPLYPLYFLGLILPGSLVGWTLGLFGSSSGRWQRTERAAPSCVAS